MAKRESVKVEKREIFGKKLKKLRKEDIIPANIYGKEFKSTAVQLPVKEFKNIFNKVHETGLVDLQFDGKALPVLIHNVQIDPRSQEPLHADFYKVDLKEKITAKIPIVAVGEAIAVKDNKGLLLQQLNELEVEALPTELPEKIEVDVEGLKEVDEEIKVSDLKVAKEVTVLNEPSQAVFKIAELITKEAEEQAKAEEAAAAEAKEEGVTETDTGAGGEKEAPVPKEEKSEQPQEEKKE